MGKLVAQNKWLFIGAALCVLISVVIDYLTPLLLAETLDYYLSGQPSTMPAFVNRWVDSWGGPNFMARNLWIVGLALVGLNIVGGAINFFKGRWQSKAGENVALYLRERLYEHIQHLPFSYHVKAETGDMVQRCTSDVDTVRRFLASQLLAVVSSVLMIVVALTMLFSKNVKLALISMVMVPAIFCFAFLFFKWVVKAFGDADVSEGRLSAVLQENLTGVRVVRAFGRERDELEKFQRKNNNYANIWMKLGDMMTVFWSLGDVMSMAQVFGVIAIGVQLCVKGEITLGTYLAFVSYTRQLTWPVRALGRTLSEMSKAGVSIDRLLYILGAEPEKGPEAPVAANLSGDIRFEHVSFAYAQKKVLDDVSFTVKGGSTLGVFGETGSGKSTIALLLARLYDPGEGRITIGGVDVKDMNPSELRRGVGVVLQEPFLFSRTVAQNIAITRENVSRDEIEQAAREACLHDAIGSFQAGYETVVGERGVTLSGGQKQRTAIARTLLEHAPIMVFDDALSAVDAKTDEAIRGRLREAAGGSTMILIAHRVATLMQADQIIVLRDGRIVEQGAPEALLAQGGLFARTARMQSAEGEGEAE